jgi:hypothetical protein
MSTRWIHRILGRKLESTAPITRPGAPQSAAKPANPYQAVAIIACKDACPAARQIAGRKFLARSAPRLPLQGCTRSGTCTCRFEKHQDRRSTEQREPYADARGIAYPGVEKRLTRGRRKSDR